MTKQKKRKNQKTETNSETKNRDQKAQKLTVGKHNGLFNIFGGIGTITLIVAGVLFPVGYHTWGFLVTAVGILLWGIAVHFELKDKYDNKYRLVSPIIVLVCWCILIGLGISTVSGDKDKIISAERLQSPKEILIANKIKPITKQLPYKRSTKDTVVIIDTTYVKEKKEPGINSNFEGIENVNFSGGIDTYRTPNFNLPISKYPFASDTSAPTISSSYIPYIIPSPNYDSILNAEHHGMAMEYLLHPESSYYAPKPTKWFDSATGLYTPPPGGYLHNSISDSYVRVIFTPKDTNQEYNGVYASDELVNVNRGLLAYPTLHIKITGTSIIEISVFEGTEFDSRISFGVVTYSDGVDISYPSGNYVIRILHRTPEHFQFDYEMTMGFLKSN